MGEIEQFHVSEIERLATDVGQPEAAKAIPGEGQPSILLG
jgi:hypothetical protein